MGRWWVSITVTAVLALTAVFIAHLRLSAIPDLAVGHSPQPPMLGQPRTRAVVYELGGPPGVMVVASYLDTSGVSRAARVRVPWTLRATSDELTLATGVMASADNQAVSCRILIDGAVRAAQQGTSVVNCEVPVA